MLRTRSTRNVSSRSATSSTKAPHNVSKNRRIHTKTGLSHQHKAKISHVSKKMAKQRITSPITSSQASITTSKISNSLNKFSAFTSNVRKYNPFVQHMRFMSSMPPSGALLELPALSPTMEQGTLSKWYKKQGELIKPGDLIADVGTDKAVVGFEAQDEYYLAAIIHQPGDTTIPVGTPIGITVEDEADMAAAQEYAKTLMSGAPSSPVAPAPTATKTQSQPSSSPKTDTTTKSTSNKKKTIKKIVKKTVSVPDTDNSMPSSSIPDAPKGTSPMELPALSPTMEQGNLTKWYKTPGDVIRPGDLIADIQTDKAVVGFEAQDECYLAAILVQPGDFPDGMPVGSRIAITVDDEADIPAAQAYAKALKQGGSNTTGSSSSGKMKTIEIEEEIEVEVDDDDGDSALSSTSGQYTHTKDLSPAVLHLVADHNIDISSVKPTGPGGRLLKGDILEAIANGTAKKRTKTTTSTSSDAATTTTTTTTPATATTSKSSQQGGGATSTPPGTRARRSRPRSYIDIPITNDTGAINKIITENKTQIPHHYSQINVSLKSLNSFVNTYAKEVDTNTALVMVIAKSFNKYFTKSDIKVSNKALGITSIVPANQTYQLGQIYKTIHAEQPGINASNIDTSLSVSLYTDISTTGLTYGTEPLLNNTILNIAIGTPSDTISVSGDNKTHIDRTVMIGVTGNTLKINEDTSAQFLKTIKAYTENPISLLL